jgi:hypothetical protein
MLYSWTSVKSQVFFNLRFFFPSAGSLIGNLILPFRLTLLYSLRPNTLLWFVCHQRKEVYKSHYFFIKLHQVFISFQLHFQPCGQCILNLLLDYNLISILYILVRKYHCSFYVTNMYRFTRYKFQTNHFPCSSFYGWLHERPTFHGFFISTCSIFNP